MHNDPIGEEVRRIREELAAKHNFDIKAIVEAARKQQWEPGRKVVSFVGKKKPSPPADSAPPER